MQVHNYRLIRHFLRFVLDFSRLWYFEFSFFRSRTILNCALLIGAPWIILWVICLQPTFPNPHFTLSRNRNKIVMFTLMSDPFSFMVALAGSWGSLHTVPYEFPDDYPRIFLYWREFIVLFMAIFGIVWKYRKQIFFKKIKKTKKTYSKKGHAKKTCGKKVYYKKLYYKKRNSKPRTRKWIGEWFGLWIG